MRRDELIVSLLEQESRKLLELSIDFTDKPKKGLEHEWKVCKQRIGVFEQMIEEIPMDHIKNDKVTGSIQQIFIGTFENQPDLYLDCKNSTNMYYYINMTIMGCGDDQFYKDERLLRLSYKVWWNWFF